MTWQLIETAPRDGTTVLIGWFHLPGQNHQDVAFFAGANRLKNGDKDRWVGSGVKWISDTNDPYLGPSHWMPLPEPPEIEK